MGIINTRKMATSQPRNFSRGLPLLPIPNSQFRPAGVQTIGRGTPTLQNLSRCLVNTTIPLVFWRFHARVDVDVFAGSFFGFNLEYDVSGVTNNDGSGFIGLFNDRAAGGLGFGVSFEVSGQVRIEERTGGRLSGNLLTGFRWEAVWATTLNRTFGFNVDPVNLALNILRRATGGVLPIEIVQGARRVGSAGAIWGYFDEIQDQLSNRGEMSLRPRINFSPNILTIIPEVAAVLQKFRKIGLRLSLGPTLNVVYPIDFEVANLETEDGRYNIVARGRPTITLGGGPVRNLAPTVSSVRIIMGHTMSFRFELGLFVTFSFLGMASIDEQAVFEIGFGQSRNFFNRLLGPFFTALDNSNVVAASEVEMPEVVWG